MKKTILFFIGVVIIGGGFWLSQNTQQTTRDLYGVYSLESSESNSIKKNVLSQNVLSLTKNGNKKTIINDLSVLFGYPKDDYVCGLNIVTSLANNIFFEEQPCGSGVFYSSIYILDTQNFDKGFEKVQNFLVGGISNKGYLSQDGSKIIGINSQKDRKLYVMDIKKNITPTNIYEASTNKTFFFPSFYGDDIIDVQWKSNNELEIKEYLIDEINRIDANNPETFPSAVNTQILRL